MKNIRIQNCSFSICPEAGIGIQKIFLEGDKPNCIEDIITQGEVKEEIKGFINFIEF